MEYETIKDLLKFSRIAGIMEGLATVEGAQISRRTAILMDDSAEILSAYIADVCKEEVIPDDGEPKTKIGFADIRLEGTPDQ